MIVRTAEEARAWRAQLEKALPAVPDKDASGCVDLYPTLKQDGSLIKAGTRINWNGWLKQATVDLWDIEANDPDHAPTLWAKILYKDGVRVIPDVITAAEAFALDELGWWDGAYYQPQSEERPQERTIRQLLWRTGYRYGDG